MRRFSFKQILLIALGTIAIAAFVGYGLFEARRLIEGPRIIVSSPVDGSATSGPEILISGRVYNAAFFSIDGKQAFADEHGNFSETLAPPPGFAAVEIAARDRFGRVAIRDIRITILDYCKEDT